MQTINRSTEKEFYNKDIQEFIKKERCPSILGSNVIEDGQYDFEIFEQFGDQESSEQMCEGLHRFLKKQQDPTNSGVKSYIAIFRTPGYMSEIDFEEKFWKHLGCAESYDAQKNSWGKNDLEIIPKASDFLRISIGGKEFYVMGFHPMSNLQSHRFQHICLVFTLRSHYGEQNSTLADDFTNHWEERCTEMDGNIEYLLNIHANNAKPIKRKVGQ